jgi:ABC-2 type transport system permease protein
MAPDRDTTTTAAPPVPAWTGEQAGMARTFLAILGRDVFVTGRELPAFLAQVVLQPFFIIFVFGRLLADLGFTRPGYAQLLLPGVIALTVVLTGLQGTALPLVIEFSFTKEIEDRLLAPLPVSMVAVEKMVFGAMRALVAGAVMLPVGAIVLGDLSYRADRLWLVVVFGVLGALVGGGMGMTLGTLVQPNRINIVFALVLTPLFFTGCTQYPWPSLSRLPWFKALTLLNPMTYVSEGMRSAMVPHLVPHMQTGVAAGLLVVATAIFGFTGIRGFLRRAVD